MPAGGPIPWPLLKVSLRFSFSSCREKAYCCRDVFVGMSYLLAQMPINFSLTRVPKITKQSRRLKLDILP